MRRFISAIVSTAVICFSACSGQAVQTSPSNPFSGLPELPAFDDQHLRSVSDAKAGYKVYGFQPFSSDVTDELKASATALGLQMVLSSQVQALAYAIYRLEPTHLDVEEYIYLQTAYPGSTGTWYGLSNYDFSRWDFAPLPDSEGHQENIRISESNETASGAIYLVVLAFGGATAAISSVERHGYDSYTPYVGAYRVGPGHNYQTIEAAYNDVPAAGNADIVVYPKGTPYAQPHLLVEKPNVRFWGLNEISPYERIQLDGSGYNYTGAGSVPRAVFQFNPGADGGMVRGFEIYNAHNDSYNGAAVRINQANHVVISNCEIHACDMGIMSNGDLSDGSGADQYIAFSQIHSCGNLSDPGYNHNLYLGGTSVTMHCCEVFGSLTGHNIKSRAHFNRIEYSYIHDSSNRELDLVDDSENTVASLSNALLLGNVIVKDPNCPGNRNVIHFGQDGGNDHDGRLTLIHNTIVTPFISPVVSVDAPSSEVHFINNLIWDNTANQNGQVLVAVSNGAQLSNVTGEYNWLASHFSVPPQFAVATTWQGADGDTPSFANAADGYYSLMQGFPNIIDVGLPWELLPLEIAPGRVAQPRDNWPLAFVRDISDGVPVESQRIPIGGADLGAHELVYNP